MGAIDQPAAEVAIDGALVRALLREQHPDLAELPLTPVDHGWDNVIYRLGDDRTVRLPRRELAAKLILHEHLALPRFGPSLPLPVPVPERLGEPSEALAYPWHWSVAPWFPGRPALTEPIADPARAAAELGRFLRALHRPAPADAPANPYRGVPLADRRPLTERFLAQLGDDVDGPGLLAVWDRHERLPRWDGPKVWLHGDLHPNNVLVHDGAISAVIDFGDVTAGDPATDLMVAWMLFDEPERRALRDAAGEVDDVTWGRARGWALALGIAYLTFSADHADFERIGRATIARVLAEAAAG